MPTTEVWPAADPSELVGRWRLDRTLQDLLSGQRGCAHGELLIALDTPDGRLSWRERAVMRWQSRQVPVTRDLWLVRHGTTTTPTWDVTFSDGRAFHPWRVGELLDHPCAEDRYLGEITAASADRLRTVWDVTGPTKHQRYVTRLIRLSA